MKPYKQKVLVIDANEHGVYAMCNSQLVVMSTYTELQKWVCINIAYIYFCLMIIYEIDFGRIKNNLILVYLQILFVFVCEGLILTFFKVRNTLFAHFCLTVHELLFLTFVSAPFTK